MNKGYRLSEATLGRSVSGHAVSTIALNAGLRSIQAEEVAKAIALVIARKGISDDGGFKSIDRDKLAQETADQMWPHLLDEAKAAMRVCGVG